jgi:hypothetical protein
MRKLSDAAASLPITILAMVQPAYALKDFSRQEPDLRFSEITLRRCGEQFLSLPRRSQLLRRLRLAIGTGMMIR